MELINKTDANLNIALIAKNKAKSDAQKVLMGRVLFMMDNMPTIEAIPKTDYENRLKADMVAMLTELQMDIEECVDGGEGSPQFEQGVDIARCQVLAMIDERINGLRG